MKIDTDPQKIAHALTRGVERIYPNRGELEKALFAGKKLRIYNGIDPTGKLHLGHLVVLRKLRQFQDLGHDIIVLIGDFTATIGDPTDKTAPRQPLTRQQVLQNSRDYKKQISKVLDLKKANVRFLHNEQWTNKLKPKDFLDLMSRFTVAGLLARDMFQERIKAGKDIHVHEFVYPIFQAYDGVIMDVDMEIGGNDQMFNMLAGRDLLKKLKNKEKFVLTTKLLTDSTGKKMGKTEGNMVNLDDPPNEMFGKIMSWPDELIAIGFELLTDVPLPEVQSQTNPRGAKARLAKEVVELCCGENAALAAQQEFDRVFRKKQQPADIPHISLRKRELALVDLLVETGIAASKSQARRLIEQKGITINGVLQEDPAQTIVLQKEIVIQAGKRHFVSVKPAA